MGLDASISTLTWTQVSLILLVILATVIVSEWVSAKNPACDYLGDF